LEGPLPIENRGNQGRVDARDLGHIHPVVVGKISRKTL
jgi:hypothetical protein